MYQELSNEFQGSAEVKEKADKLQIGTSFKKESGGKAVFTLPGTKKVETVQKEEPTPAEPVKEEPVEEEVKESTAEETAEETLLNFFNLLADSTRQLSVVDIQPTDRYEQHVAMFYDKQLDKDEVSQILTWKQEANPPADLLKTIWIRARGGQHHADWYKLAPSLRPGG